MYPKGKRAVTDIVLMMGVAIAMAVLLVGGFSLVTKFVQVQAQTSPKFTATELVALMNTVQAAPETVTFDYYTPTDQNGYPIIGSLEIDASKNTLCIGPKTEGEMFGEIADQAAIGAGFGAIGFASNRIRSAVSARSARTAAINNALFGNFKKTLSDTMLTTALTDPDEKGKIARKILTGKGLNDKEVAEFLDNGPNAMFKGAERKNLGEAADKLTQVDIDSLDAVDKTLEIQSAGLLTRIRAKIPFTEEYEISKFGQKVEAYGAANGERTLYQKAKGVVGVVGKGKGFIFAGIAAAGTYWLTGGDWTATLITFVQMSVMHYLPQLIEYIIKNMGTKFATRLAGAVPKSVATATAYKLGMDCATKAPLPIGPACLAAASIAKAAEVITNVIFATYNAISMDLTLTQIHNAATKQVAAERNSISCEKFVAPKKVLLTPPNCKPQVDFGKTFKANQKILVGEFLPTAVGLWAATGWAAATSYIPNAKLIQTQIIPYGELALGLVPAYGSLAYTLYKDPTGMVPMPSCGSSCDTTYMRQDCPNWFLSSPSLSGAGAESKVAGYSFEILLNGGPLCAGLALTGMAGTLCDAARYTTAITIFLAAPEYVFNFFMHGDEVGVTKTVGKKTAPEFPALTNEFADNTGYWYAELPYVIELTKVYTDDPSSANRNPPLIVRKV